MGDPLNKALSQASLFTRAARSSASLIRVVALSHAAAASRAEVSATSIIVTQVASAVAVASHAWVTSSCNMGMMMQQRASAAEAKKGGNERT
jgi:hypothetical protein